MKRLQKTLLLVTALTITIQSTQAQEIREELSPKLLSYGHQITLYSEILQESRTLNVYLPESFHEASEEHTYPLIMISGSHGHKFFHMITGIIKHLSSVNRMPECVIISVADGKYYAPNVYTNGMWSGTDQLEFNADPDLYIQHLKQELFPYFQNNFRTIDYRMIIGISGSSVFPLHTFARVPDLFQAHITMATADMIGMGYEEGRTFIEEFEQSMVRNPNRKAQLYFGIADDDLIGKKSYEANISSLQKKLAPYTSKNLSLKVDIFPNEDHYDSIIKAMLSAVEMIFPIKKWSPKYREIIKQSGDAMANIDAYHQHLSEEYGFSVLPKAERWNSVNCLRFIGGKLLRDGRTKEAITVMERRVKYRPRLAAARQGLSEALEAENQIEEAILVQKQAVRLAKLYDKNYLPGYEEKLLALTAKTTNSQLTQEENKPLSKSKLETIIDKYLAAYKKVFRKGSTVADVDKLYNFYTSDFEYNHPGYGDIYSRALLYDNTVKFLKKGSYNDAKERKVLNKIIGLNAIVLEQQYVDSNESTMTLIKFRGDKIYYIEEYW